MTASQLRSSRIPWYLILIFFLLAVGIGLTGYYYYEDHKETIRSERSDDLSAIADLKVNEISWWRKERLGDADVFLDNSLVISDIHQWLRRPDRLDLEQSILNVMNSLRKNYDYRAVLLLDATVSVRLSVSGKEESIGVYAHTLATEALRTGKVILSDLYRSETGGDIRIDLIVPLFTRQGQDTSHVGVLLLRIDPYKFLYALIQSWPTPSRTSETLLVRAEADDVMFLNELRHRKNTALTLRLPASDNRLPAAIAVREGEGVVEGVDYRGVPVLAAIRKIPESPWFLITKVDAEEVFVPIRERFWLVTFLVGMLMAGAGLSLGLVWHRQYALFYRKQYEAELKHHELSERYEYLTRHASDIILLRDYEGAIIDANERAIAAYGFAREELLLLNMDDIVAPEARSRLDAQNKDQEGIVYETVHQRKDGTQFPAEVSTCVIETGGQKLFQSIIRDITERKLSEEALRRAHDHLEMRVQERTTDLKRVNEVLLTEIAERKKAEDALRESEDKFRRLSNEFHALLQAITDPLTLLSPDLKVLWGNKSAANSSPRKLADPTGQYCYIMWHNRSAPCEGCPAVKSLHTGREEISQLESPNGKLWELKAFPVNDENGRVTNVLTVASDITEKMALQADAMRAAHLASLGELAAGVAHEINNPMNGIINYAQILFDECSGAGAECDIPKRIIREANRVATIVRSLLSFARETKEEKKPVNVHEILRETLDLTGAQLWKDGIILRVNVSRELPPIVGHFQQVQQVFLNVINNARYALNQKYPGKDEDKILEITGEATEIVGRPHLEVSFCDHGTGIAANIMDKVLDPFFSTKPRGVGTGLGLSISHGIVSDHGGKLTIDSVEGEFAKVRIILPAGGNPCGKEFLRSPDSS